MFMGQSHGRDLLGRWEAPELSLIRVIVEKRECHVGTGVQEVSLPRTNLMQLTGKRATPRSEPHKNMPTVFNFIANYTKINKPRHIAQCQINLCPLVKPKPPYKMSYRISLLVLSHRFARPPAPMEHPDLPLDTILLAVSHDTKLTPVYCILYKKSKSSNGSMNVNPGPSVKG